MVLRKESIHKGIAYGILLTIPAILLLLEEYRMVGQLGIQTSDARVYIGVADNFVSSGHFITTVRPNPGLVVPPGTPFMITLFRLLGLNNTGIIVAQALLFGLDNIFLYETERNITNRGLWSPIIFTGACMRCYLRLGVVMVEHYYLFLLCLAIWVIYSELRTDKKLIILNLSGLAMLLTRPVLSPIYSFILLYTLFWCGKNRNYKIGVGMLLLPIVLLSVNLMVNHRETGEWILLENYSGYDLYISSRSDAPVTIEEAGRHIIEEEDILLVYDDGTIKQTERNTFFQERARKNIREHFGLWLQKAVLRGYELFLRKYYWVTLYMLIGGLLMAAGELKQGKYRAAIMLGLTLMLTAITSFGVVELRYTLIIWPMASIHGAFLTDLILRRLSKIK